MLDRKKLARKARQLGEAERQVLIEVGLFTANELKTGCSPTCEEKSVDLITYAAAFSDGTIRLSRCPRCGKNWTRPGPSNRDVRPI